MPSVTLKSVAAAAGVSVTTVSNAYNRPDQLSPDLRERILATAASLGYQGPDAVARSLRRGRAGAIGVLFSETLSYVLSDPFAADYLRGLAGVAERHQTGLLLIAADIDDPSAGCDAVRQAVVDGFVLECIQDPSPVLDAVLGRGLPAVSSFDLPERSVPVVGIDDRDAARSVGEHLAALGHQVVGVITDAPGAIGGEEPLSYAAAANTARNRDSGLRLQGLGDGLPDADIRAVSAGRNTRAHGRDAAARLLDRRDRPTAIFAVSDVLAAGVLDALRERGLTAGVEVSVVGFDDVPIAADLGLTTVRQPIVDKGRLAAQRLLEPAEGDERKAWLATELIVRSSSGPAPGPVTLSVHRGNGRQGR